MKDVILVESPTKAKTLTRFLAGKYEVIASMGHIRDLPKSKLGVDLENNFEPQYIIPKDKQKTVKQLKAVVKGAKLIILATDPDREGEAISFHLHEILKDVNKNSDFERIVFHEITKGAIDAAMTHKRKIDQDLVNAQTARRVLDRIVGYKLSPILWRKVKRHLSAGRVQSVALRLIVEREKEIGIFASNAFYRIVLTVNKKGEKNTIDFELTKIEGKKIEESKEIKLYDGAYKYSYTNLSKDIADIIIGQVKNEGLTIVDVQQKETKRSSYPPFITSTLQQAAFRRFGYTGKRTMSLAQRLYEEGHITYHRTDSFNLSDVFIKASRSYIEKEFGKEYLSPDVKVFKTKSKSAQEAHEAIRPVNIEEEKEKISKELGNDYANIYDLIYRRAVATQMSDAIFASTKITGEITKKETYTFEASGSVLRFQGFLKLYSIKEDETQVLPEIKVGEILDYKNASLSEHATNPPPRYNEASLVSSLEKHGIGRPSTYAPIISTLFDRLYIEKNEGRLSPTEIGISVTEFLVKNFSNIDDIPFTARLEEELDEIAEGKLKWQNVLKDFYTPFEKQLKKAENAEGVKIEIEYSDRTCPKDEGRLIVRQSKFGKFLACENFPDCRFTESITETLDIPCPKDGGNVVMKRTRKGRTFYGCSNYPNCDFAVWKKEDIIKPKEPTTATN
ncbi:MAG: type I DNA topoisomerase [Candidatus Levybacteria bacterium]|nr:type I DNA topoisomerase [Candidatus Levybacteria bacterium]